MTRRPRAKPVLQPADATPPPSTPTPRMRKVFWLITLSLPVLILVLLETGLRIAHYGGDLDLVLPRTVAGREYYLINRAVAHRYFPGVGAAIPEPRDQTFLKIKGPHVRRIFCLGESTMAGFPYDFHATAPSFLADRLQQMFPEDTIEVINVGLSAIGSYVILDFLQELAEYSPDLFIVYTGHNEFYGIYGLGSSLAPGSAWTTRLTIGLLRFRTFLLVRNLYASAFSSSRPAAAQDGTLMEQVVGKGVILLGSPEYDEARTVFRENIGRMIDAAQARGIPIMFSALVSNLKDHPPFSPVFAQGTSEEMRRRYVSILATAHHLLTSGDPHAAFDESNRAIAIDSSHAGGWFLRGTAAYALGDNQNADRSFRRAKDLDALRFRATEDFQEVLIAACAERHVRVIRTDSVFAAASPHGIVGAELMTEHLHPNLRGYFLMGKGMAEAMREGGILFPRERWASARVLDDAAYLDLSTVSAFDSLTGAIRTALLTQHWPFPARATLGGYEPTSPEAVIAYAYVRGTESWSGSRYKMATLYGEKKRFDLAARECLALAKAVPSSYEPVLRAADYFQMGGDVRNAEACYRRSFRTEPNPYAPLKLGIMLLEAGRDAEAEDQLRIALDPAHRFVGHLDATATSAAHYLLGVAAAKHTRFGEARAEIDAALRIDPSNGGARSLLAQIEAWERQHTARH
jgi:Tfp pilus assembly protein PilF/lysophospholipase L1-like esterase